MLCLRLLLPERPAAPVTVPGGRAAMTREELSFADLMSDAHFAVRALDEFEMRESRC